MSKIKIFSLGGLNENGKNMYVIEVDKDIFVIDAGLKYADEHMLGIDYQNIKNECFSDYRLNVLKTNSSNLSSYELLELLIENSEKVIEHDNNINNKLKAINYYKSGIKCQIFKKLSDFEKFNFAVINLLG